MKEAEMLTLKNPAHLEKEEKAFLDERTISITTRWDIYTQAYWDTKCLAARILHE